MNAAHVVERLVFEAGLADEALAFEMQARLAGFASVVVPQVVDEVFSAALGEGPGDGSSDAFSTQRTVQLASLDVALGNLPPAETDGQWAARLREALGRALDDRLREHRGGLGAAEWRERSRAEAEFELLWTWLHHGVLPWHATRGNTGAVDALLTHVLARQGATLARALSGARSAPLLMRRLARQASQAHLRAIGRALADDPMAEPPPEPPGGLSVLQRAQQMEQWLLEQAARGRRLPTPAAQAPWRARVQLASRRTGKPHPPSHAPSHAPSHGPSHGPSCVPLHPPWHPLAQVWPHAHPPQRLASRAARAASPTPHFRPLRAVPAARAGGSPNPSARAPSGAPSGASSRAPSVVSPGAPTATPARSASHKPPPRGSPRPQPSTASPPPRHSAHKPAPGAAAPRGFGHAMGQRPDAVSGTTPYSAARSPLARLAQWWRGLRRRGAGVEPESGPATRLPAGPAGRPAGAAMPWPMEAPADPVAVGDTLYIDNAGLVLAGPWLPRLWDKLGWTVGARFKDPISAERAVQLLQWLADGPAAPARADGIGSTAEADGAAEHRLLLNKLLCGIEPELPLLRGLDPGAAEIEAAQSMLGALIAHWGALGQTSVAGLRETFLRREGALSRGPEGWRLQVQASAFDMLLDRLPWGYKTLRYPWMKEVLHVQWR